MPEHLELIAIGFTASFVAGVGGTGLGAIPAVLLTRASDRVMDGLLGFAAGIMLAATAFGLVTPLSTREASERQSWGSCWASGFSPQRTASSPTSTSSAARKALPRDCAACRFSSWR